MGTRRMTDSCTEDVGVNRVIFKFKLCFEGRRSRNVDALGVGCEGKRGPGSLLLFILGRKLGRWSCLFLRGRRIEEERVEEEPGNQVSSGTCPARDAQIEVPVGAPRKH